MLDQLTDAPHLIFASHSCSLFFSAGEGKVPVVSPSVKSGLKHPIGGHGGGPM